MAYRKDPRLVAGVLLCSLFLFSCQATEGHLVPSPPVYESDDFARYVPDGPDVTPSPAPTPEPTASPTPRPRPERPKATPRPQPKATSQPSPSRVRRQTNRNISGKASWHATGRSGLYAAACKKLRVAIGPGWRGEHVIVEYNGRWLGVVLNDWCGSHDKLIDLSDEVFRELTATKRYPNGRLSMGVIRVAVGWR